MTIASDSLARSRQLLDINKALIAAGRMAQFEIIQTEADTANQELGVEEARNQVEASRLALLQLLALDLSNPVKASDTPKAEPLQINELEAQRLALEHQPDYLSQVIAGEQAEINLTVARNNSLWDVSLVGGANQARDQFSGGYEGRANRNWQSYAGIQIEVPIGNPPRAKAKCRRKSTWTPRLSASRKRSSNWSARWQMRSAMYGRAGASTRLPGAHATCRKKLEFEREAPGGPLQQLSGAQL